VGLFGVLDSSGELVSELPIEFFDRSDHHTEHD
jgi:hypothetical protein